MEKKFEFKPFDRVLVRDDIRDKWQVNLFSSCAEEDDDLIYGCIVYRWRYCIPFEGNEHLLGTTDDYEEPYEPKDGDFVTITNHSTPPLTGEKIVMIFKEWGAGLYIAYAYCKNREGAGTEFDRGGGCVISTDDGDILKPSTEEEKQGLLHKLHEDGKDWDAEKKEIVDCKWTPQEGERVWRIEFNSAYTEFNLIERIYDSSMALSYKNGLIFKLYDEMATKKANQMTEAVKNVK